MNKYLKSFIIFTLIIFNKSLGMLTDEQEELLRRVEEKRKSMPQKAFLLSKAMGTEERTRLYRITLRGGLSTNIVHELKCSVPLDMESIQAAIFHFPCPEGQVPVLVAGKTRVPILSITSLGNLEVAIEHGNHDFQVINSPKILEDVSAKLREHRAKIENENFVITRRRNKTPIRKIIFVLSEDARQPSVTEDLFGWFTGQVKEVRKITIVGPDPEAQLEFDVTNFSIERLGDLLKEEGEFEELAAIG